MRYAIVLRSVSKSCRFYCRFGITNYCIPYFNSWIFIRSDNPQAICHSCWFTSDGLHTCQSEGTRSTPIFINPKHLTFLFQSECGYQSFSGYRAHGRRCSHQSKWLSWNCVQDSPTSRILEGMWARHIIILIKAVDIWYLHVCVHLQLQLDDSILKTIETSSKQELKEARDLVRRVRRRDLYQVS